MSNNTSLLITRLKNGAWDKRWPKRLLQDAARMIEDLVVENSTLRDTVIQLRHEALQQGEDDE